MQHTRLPDYMFQIAETVGADPEDEKELAVKAKVVKNSSKGVRKK